MTLLSVEARRFDLARALLTLLALLPYALGWTAAKTVRGSLLALSWTRAAVVAGWRAAHDQGGG